MSGTNDGVMAQTSSTASMATLVDYLKTAFRQEGPDTYSVPDEIKPLFKLSFQPNESRHLRDLHKTLEDGRPKNILRLVPSSLCPIISIVLHYPYSQAQSKLLYLFVETVRQYKNETILRKLMARVQTDPVTADSVRERREYMSKKLAACVLRHVTSDGKDIQLRWRATQLLCVVLHENLSATNVIVQSQCHKLSSMLEADESYVLRILVADVIRELLHTGAERANFKSPRSQDLIEKFPVAKEPDATWMSRVVDHLSDIDVGRAFSEQTERIFRVQRLQCGDSACFQYSSAFIATISKDITFLIPNGASMLTLLSIPLTSDLCMTSVARESETSSSSIIDIRYRENNGYRITNGNKSAIDNITITFCDEESADSFQRLAEERKGTISERANEAGPEAAQKVLKPLDKHSWSIVDVSQEHVGTEPVSDPVAVNNNRNDSGRLVEGTFPETLNSHLPAATTASNQNRHPAISDRFHTPQQANLYLTSPKPSTKASVTFVARSSPVSADQAQYFPNLKCSTRNPNKRQKQTFSIPVPMAPLDDGRSKQPVQSPPPAPGMAGLKKRSLGKAATQRSQAQTEPSSDYDLPNGNEESAHPDKKAKTKSSREPAKTTAAAESQKRSTRAVVTDKDAHRKSKDRQRTTNSPDKGTQRTAASTRARRAAKTQTYVENSDDSSDDKAKEDPPGQDNEEHAEDSYPLENNAAEAAMQSAKMSFTSNLKTLVATEDPRSAQKATTGTSDGTTTTPQRVVNPLIEESIPSVSEKVLRKPSIVHFEPQGPGNQATPLVASASKDTQRISPGLSAGVQVRKPNALCGSADAQGSGPDVSQMPDDLVCNEGVLTSGENVNVLMHEDRNKVNAEVHNPEDNHVEPPEDQAEGIDGLPAGQHSHQAEGIDGITGGRNSHQAESMDGITDGRHSPTAKHPDEGNVEVAVAEPKETPNTENRSQSDAESATAEKHDLVMHGVRLESNADTVTANVIYPVHAEQANRRRYREDGNPGRADSPMHHSKTLSEETDERPSQVRSRTSMEQEDSEYVESESSDDVMEVTDVSAETPLNIRRRSTGPQTPALDDIPPVEKMTRQKESIRYQDHDRRSIDVSAILDDEYPQAERVINTHKIRSILRSGVEDVSVQVEQYEAGADAELAQHATRGKGNAMAALATATTTTTKAQSSDRINCMGPPPTRSTLSKLYPPTRSVLLKTNLQPSATGKNSNKVVQDQAPVQHHSRLEEPKPVPPVPVRVKKAVPPSNPVPTVEAEVPPGTPMSFCTRWDMDAPDAAVDATDGEMRVPKKDMAQKSGDTSLTLINGDDFVDTHRSGTWPRRGRRLRSLSTDDMSSIVSPSRDEAFAPTKNQARTDLKVRDSQRGLLNAVMEITKDVLLRFGQEEDAIRTKVDEFCRGGDQIVQTLTDSWNERLDHEQRNMTHKLAEEKNVLTEACVLFKEQNTDSWRGVISEADMKTRAEKRSINLTATIEALKSRQEGM
ncbi:hypothetical protein LTR10_022732 [Elasticomyces elasticus]|uniref:Uncharacterized protein n=1 Tax=Exophiala sideris TaxID=1016849 RepID=A0ABR0J9W8_9EURO|nr:hypothetical protein LTR10_022732 [Elasticomyces elasticus]KAK5026120.1 hypothetical protein LTS07_007645 [Exophiala sideris]KAK5032374.1 hypothetical protein LTR13_007197 [Exophiala sideris]KAK5059530.1 hypothetical protein LTR69_006119 [Exophiala sideris]KAK5186692.1 hypothetical protein LTR44_000698 [Eurotiomycetes sp. CCFEE 6388]